MATVYGTERPAAVLAYLAAIIEVGKKHGLSLAHEDGHGAFIVEPRDADEHNDRWLLDAMWMA